MDLYRYGSRRYRGSTNIVSGMSFKTGGQYSWQNNVSWNPGYKALEIRPRSVPHTDGITHHDYVIRLTLEDISSLIGILGHAGSASNAKQLRDHLGKDITAIVKLLACAAGIAPVAMAEDEPKTGTK